MFKKFSTHEALYQEMDRDKSIAEAGIGSANRYPLRFVLFENFSDFYEFIRKCAEKGIQVVGIEKWLDENHPDVFPTYSSLSRRIEEYIKQANGKDSVIAPFSELARFYGDNEFRALITTIRLKEANYISQEKNLRIYIPLIGMLNRLDAFRNDNVIQVWEYVAPEVEKHYRLILCNGTDYDFPLDEEVYSYSKNVHDWVVLWKQGNRVNSTIVCTSKTIFNISGNARPDNAFDYTICNNAFEFLRDGVKLIPQNVLFKQEELKHWEKLVSEIGEPRKFSLEKYVLSRFNVLRLEEAEFMQFWFNYKDPFSRWLLRIYYLTKFCEGKYLCRALSLCETTHSSELFEKLALLIFDEDSSFAQLSERLVLLTTGKRFNAKLTEQAEARLRDKLIEIAESPECGYTEALKYITPLTNAEKQLLVTWLGQGKIDRENVKTLSPDLYAYTSPLPLNIFADATWLEFYFNEYRASKIANVPTHSVTSLLKLHNGSTASFEKWRNEFRTVKTILANREDIDVYFWIDGLGVDWIPFISKMIEEHQGDGVYLNEVYIATAQLPSTTSINKAVLEALPHGSLKKVGDLDSFAHANKKYPDYICPEMERVRRAVQEALEQYNGKKIAFVSDHGISYLAQHGAAFSLSGAKGEHSGRCATWKKSPIPQDKKYVIEPNTKMLCSLSHDSLADKTPYGLGAHGGATPEELLVPILIVSGQRNQSNYSARLLKSEVTANEPVIRYEIKGIQPNTMDIPEVKYNGESYPLHKVGNNQYESEKLQLLESVNKVTLVIGTYSHTDAISVKTGVNEDDIFGDF